jgi:hypothetical protein
MFVYLVTVIMLLFLAHLHYTVDILVAVIIASTLLTHDRFLKHGVAFFERASPSPDATVSAVASGE